MRGTEGTAGTEGSGSVTAGTEGSGSVTAGTEGSGSVTAGTEGSAELAAQFGPYLERCRFPEPRTPLTCAVSGGADSSALAVLAVAAGCEVTLAHVDHGLRAESSAEANVVAELASRLGAGFVSHTVEVAPGPNLEARCRDARRAVLPTEAATGHTADDRAETLLINLMRGAGSAGVAVLRPSWRHPIAALRRSETHAICHELGVVTVRDPLNDDPRFVRNRIRHEVLPLLNEVADRDVTELLCRHSDVVAVERDAIQVLAEQLDPTNARALAAAETGLAAHAIRRWLGQNGRSYPPDAATIERILNVARGGAVAADVGGGWRVRRSHQRLQLERSGTEPDQTPVSVA